MVALALVETLNVRILVVGGWNPARITASLRFQLEERVDVLDE
jgi:hypothetical protein